MAFADLGSLGAIGSTGNNQTTLDLVTSAAIAAGDFVVVVVAADNIANGGDDNATSGVTLGIGGQALTKGNQIANALAAQAGASVSVWYGVASGALASGGTIRATFGSGTLVDASGMTARKFSFGAGNVISVEGTPGTLVGNTAADPGSLNVTTANIQCLRVRGIASQVGNNTNLTPTSTWTAWANGNSATTGTTGEICARAESLISTATGAASDPTYVSAIYASNYIAFKETLGSITGTLNISEAADTISAAGNTVVGGTLSATEANDTLSAAATVSLSGTLNVTETSDTISATGTVADAGITATLSITEAADTISATGTVLYPSITATLSVTEANDTLSATGGSVVGGTLSVNEANDTISATGGVAVDATLSVTEANDTISAAGNVLVGGTLSLTEANDTLSAAGTVVSPGITATLNVTEANDTLSSAATVALVATLNVTEASDTISAAATVRVNGTLSVTESNDTLSAAGTVSAVTQTLTVTELHDDVDDIPIHPPDMAMGGPDTPDPPPLWTPAVLAGTTLKLWFKADTLSGSDGSAIATWPDASGLGNDATQATSGNRPTLAVAHQNGLNAVKFLSSSAQWFSLPNVFTGFSQGAICFVLRSANDPGTGVTEGPFKTGSHGNNVHYPYYGDGYIYDDFGCNQVRQLVNPTPSLAAYHVGGMRSTTNDWRYYLNGVQLYQTSSNTVGWTTAPRIGTMNGQPYYFDGWMGEAVILNEFASTSDWQKLEGYLAWKWGTVSTLDASHPYKSAAPLGPFEQTLEPILIDSADGFFSHGSTGGAFLSMRPGVVFESDTFNTLALIGTGPPSTPITVSTASSSNQQKFWYNGLPVPGSDEGTDFKYWSGGLPVPSIEEDSIRVYPQPFVDEDIHYTILPVYNQFKVVDFVLDVDAFYSANAAIAPLTLVDADTFFTARLHTGPYYINRGAIQSQFFSAGVSPPLPTVLVPGAMLICITSINGGTPMAYSWPSGWVEFYDSLVTHPGSAFTTKMAWCPVDGREAAPGYVGPLISGGVGTCNAVIIQIGNCLDIGSTFTHVTQGASLGEVPGVTAPGMTGTYVGGTVFTLIVTREAVLPTIVAPGYIYEDTAPGYAGNILRDFYFTRNVNTGEASGTFYSDIIDGLSGGQKVLQFEIWSTHYTAVLAPPGVTDPDLVFGGEALGGSQEGQAALYVDPDIVFTTFIWVEQKLQPALLTNDDSFLPHTIGIAPPLLIAPDTILDDDTIIFHPDCSPGDWLLFQGKVTDVDVIYASTIRDFTQILLPIQIVSDDAIYTPTLGNIALQFLLPISRYLDIETTYTAVITDTSLKIVPLLFTDDDDISFTPVITTFGIPRTLLPLLVNDGDGFVTHIIQLPTVRTILPSLFEESETFYTFISTLGTPHLLPALMIDTEAAFSPFIVAPVPRTLSPSLVPDDTIIWNVINIGIPPTRLLSPPTVDAPDAIYAPTIAKITQFLLAPLVVEEDAFFAPSMVINTQYATAAFVIDVDVIHAARFVNDQKLFPQRYIDPEGFIPWTIGIPINSLVFPQRVTDADTFFAPVMGFNRTIFPSRVLDVDVGYGAFDIDTVKPPHEQKMRTARINSDDAFFRPQFSRYLDFVNDVDVVFTATTQASNAVRPGFVPGDDSVPTGVAVARIAGAAFVADDVNDAIYPISVASINYLVPLLVASDDDFAIDGTTTDVGRVFEPALVEDADDFWAYDYDLANDLLPEAFIDEDTVDGYPFFLQAIEGGIPVPKPIALTGSVAQQTTMRGTLNARTRLTGNIPGKKTLKGSIARR